MKKCFIEYGNHKLYISFIDAFCYINLTLGKRDSVYYFAQFVYQIKNMLYGMKKAKKFESKKSKLYRAVNECIDDILSDTIMHDFFEYISIPHVLKDNKCLDVYICRSNNYYETFADNISLDRLRTKIPLLLSTF